MKIIIRILLLVALQLLCTQADTFANVVERVTKVKQEKFKALSEDVTNLLKKHEETITDATAGAGEWLYDSVEGAGEWTVKQAKTAEDLLSDNIGTLADMATKTASVVGSSLNQAVDKTAGALCDTHCRRGRAEQQ